MTSGSNWRHLNRPQTEDARRSILPAYHGVTAKLQHFPSERLPDRNKRIVLGVHEDLDFGTKL
jgi:hypothetical protein